VDFSISFSPKNIFTIGDREYSVNSLYNSNRIYEHNPDSNYGFFYEQQHGLMVSFVITGDIGVQKILDNMIVISNNRIPISLSYDVDDDEDLNTLVTKDIDSRYICKTRRHEIKVIGLNDEINETTSPDSNYVYANIENPEKYLLLDTVYKYNNIDFMVTNVDHTVTNRFGFPKLEMNYSTDNGVTWIEVEKGNHGYRNVFGLILKTIKINLINSNSDYIEDRLDVQVQRKKGESDVRDKVFVISIRYDGVDKTVIQSVLSSARVSFS